VDDGTTAFTAHVGECLNRLRAGDPRARDLIVALCQTRLRVLVQRMLRKFPGVRRWDQTDDVCQDVLLELWKALPSLPLDSPAAVLKVAATIVKHKLIDRARKYSGPLSDAANHATDLPQEGSRGEMLYRHAVDRSNDGLDRWTAFQDAIEKLPADEREVFHLVWFLGASQQQIAEVIGVSPRTVKRLWQRARNAIRQATEGDSPELTADR
jgi:RNA polymerase sigma-70 factor (ECF subfamily)